MVQQRPGIVYVAWSWQTGTERKIAFIFLKSSSLLLINLILKLKIHHSSKIYVRDFINHPRTGNFFLDYSDNPSGQTKEHQFLSISSAKEKQDNN